MKPEDATEQKKQRALKALAVLRQKVDALLKAVPEVESNPTLSAFTEAKAKVVEEHFWTIFAYGEYYVAKVMSDLDSPLLSTKAAGNVRFYENTYKPLIEKMKGWFDTSDAPTRQAMEIAIVCKITGFDEQVESDPDDVPVRLQSDIDDYMQDYEIYACNGPVRKSILNVIARTATERSSPREFLSVDPKTGKTSWLIDDSGDSASDEPASSQPHAKKKKRLANALDSVWEFAAREIQNIYKDGFDGFDIEKRDYMRLLGELSDIDNLCKKPFFRPDEWDANEKELSPIVVAYPLRNIPVHIRERVHEIHRSFIFGNAMSAVALSRGVLEYALINQKSVIEKRLGRAFPVTDARGKTLPISTMADLAGKAFPDLKESMKTVIDYGNFVMHPQRSELPRINAKPCVDEISKIISTLYGA